MQCFMLVSVSIDRYHVPGFRNVYSDLDIVHYRTKSACAKTNFSRIPNILSRGYEFHFII